jgi:predicted ATPase/DNA-binding SARP family transcriptional activator
LPDPDWHSSLHRGIFESILASSHLISVAQGVAGPFRKGWVFEMSRLALHLFGSPHIARDGVLLPIERRKALALLAYLALTAQAHSRDTLAALLWPEYDQSAARANLRRTLAAIKNDIGDECLEIEGDTVRLSGAGSHEKHEKKPANQEPLPQAPMIWLDVAEFNRLLAEWRSHLHPEDPCPACLSTLEKAVNAYTHDFMAGFNLPDCPDFDDWQLFQREGLRRDLADALAWLSAAYTARKDFKPALTHARRWLLLDALHEPPHCQLMRIYAASGQRSAALRQYAECERILREELGVAPQAETRRLHEDILTARAAPAVDTQKVRGSVPVPRKHNLPVQSIPFVGREEFLNQITSTLEDPGCRLLSLVGPGGCGKTRLAIESGQRLLDAFSNGVFFVPLAPLRSAESILPAIAEALGFSFYEGGQPRQQLLDYLEKKNMLLILDNYEHLLEGVDIPIDVLKTAPGVKILATSRSPLNILDEQHFPVRGMSLPAREAAARQTIVEAGRFSSVKFFVQCARRIQPGFGLTQANLPQVLHICQLVDGMPLGILLAAAWLEMLSPAEIAAEIERSFDFLETDLKDMPQRQRSMRVVFEHSWKLLNENQQNTFASLSVFHGGFTREAAEKVSDAGLHDLMHLVSRSLLDRDASGRYILHELLRQFAAQRLGETPAGLQAVCARHGEYYAGLLTQWEGDMKSARQVRALNEMDMEVENCRAAWEWAAEQRRVDFLSAAMESLFLYHLWRRRIPEGESVFRFTVEKLAGADTDGGLQALAGIVACQAAFVGKLGNTIQARSLFWQSWAFILDERLENRDTRSRRALLLRLMGDLFEKTNRGEAIPLYRESLSLYRELDDLWGISCVLDSLALSMRMSGNFTEAQKYIEKSLALYHKLGDPRGEATALFRLGNIIANKGLQEEGEKRFRESIAMFHKIGDRVGYARALHLMVDSVMLSEGRYAEAQAALEEVIPIFSDLGVHGQLALSKLGMCTIMEAQGDYTQARALIQEAMDIAQKIGNLEIFANALVEMAFITAVEGQYAQAQELIEKVITEYGGQMEQQYLPAALAVLGNALCKQGQLPEARPHLHRALRKALEMKTPWVLTDIFPEISLYLCAQGEVERALELYALTAASFPAWEQAQSTKSYMASLISAAASLPPEVVAAAQERGTKRDLWETARELLAELD